MGSDSAKPGRVAEPWDRDWILFVTGAARSGTTYVAEIFDELFGFGMGPEGHFVLDFDKRVERYGDLSRQDNMVRLLGELRDASTLRIIREQWPEAERFDVTIDELLERVAGPNYASVVFAVFRAIADRLGKPHVGTKNPGYTLGLDALEDLFPGRARYVNVVRDGRDVALSTMGMSWGEDTAYACAKTWRRHIDAACEFSARIGPERFYDLCYEKIVAEPEAVFSELEAFLGIEIETATRGQFLARIAQNGMPANFNKWKSEMSVRDVEIYEAVAGRQLSHWRYERTMDAPRVGAVDAALFEMQELMRKVRRTLG